MAPFTIIAFSKFSFFSKSDIFISCLTISTIRRPASCAKTYRLESTAGIAALVCKAMPIDSAKLAIVEAVPIVIQCPADLELSCSADINSSSVISPAFTISENFQVCVPDPINCPLYRPFNIGPPDTTSVGKSQEAAPIIKAGVVLSHPTRSTTPSIGKPRMDSSTSIDARFLYSIAVGLSWLSELEKTGNSIGTPPAS